MNSLNPNFIKSRSEKDLKKDMQKSKRSIKYLDEEEKNYLFIYQIKIEENSQIKNKKIAKKIKIEFFDEKLKKPYNETIEWKLLENKDIPDQTTNES